MSNPKFDNNMQGVLFKKFKEKENGPDYGGDCEIAGVKYWISAWLNVSKDRQTKFMSLRFKAKDLSSKSAEKRETTQQSAADYNDDIPF